MVHTVDPFNFFSPTRKKQSLFCSQFLQFIDFKLYIRQFILINNFLRWPLLLSIRINHTINENWPFDFNNLLIAWHFHSLTFSPSPFLIPTTDYPYSSPLPYQHLASPLNHWRSYNNNITENEPYTLVGITTPVTTPYLCPNLFGIQPSIPLRDQYPVSLSSHN